MGARRAARLSLVRCGLTCALEAVLLSQVACGVMSCSDVLVDRVCAAFRLGCEVVP